MRCNVIGMSIMHDNTEWGSIITQLFYAFLSLAYFPLGFHKAKLQCEDLCSSISLMPAVY